MPGGDAKPDRDDLGDRDHECRFAVGQPVLVVQEEHAEADHGDLRVDVEPACDAQPDEPAVAKNSEDGCRLDPVPDLLGIATPKLT